MRMRNLRLVFLLKDIKTAWLYQYSSYKYCRQQGVERQFFNRK